MILDKDKIIRKYRKPPPLKKIKAIVKKQKMSGARFEKCFGIPPGTLRQVYCGRDLPVRFWEMFYEWGKKKPKKVVTKIVTQIEPIKGLSDRLEAIAINKEPEE